MGPTERVPDVRGLLPAALALACLATPGLVGLIDGTLLTLAPIFAAALLSGSHPTPFVGLATNGV